MSKAGRKPINAERYPSGRVKPPSIRNSATVRVPREQAGHAPALVRRAVDEALRLAGDPRLGSVIGRLLLDGKINSVQFAAAEAYAKLRGRFDRATEVPRRMAQSPSYGDARSSGKNPEPMSEKAYVAVVEQHTALLASVGRWFPMLERVCVDDNYLAEDEARSLKVALDMLAVWFGIARAA